jgi:hypothetical protein
MSPTARPDASVSQQHEQHHTARRVWLQEDDKFTMKPYCTDGSYCFFFAPIRGYNNGDMYAAVKGEP